MSTGYGWEGLRQVCAMPISAHHVPERLCGGLLYLGRYNKMFSFTLTFLYQRVMWWKQRLRSW